LLLLKEQGWETHYCHLCSGNCGSATMDAATTRRTRFYESQAAAKLLGEIWHAPIADDLELVYSVENLRKVAALVRSVKPTIVLTHAPVDYMEDHTTASRLAVTAAFARGMPNFATIPPSASAEYDTTVYHALPHGLCDPLGQPVTAELYVDTTAVHATKRAALAKHASQKNWLDVSQGMDSYLQTLDEMSQTVGQQTGKFQHAEGWRRHLHLGFSATPRDPLSEALGERVWKNPKYGR
jgi:N-acetylglucosamine malate deacetylase 1